MTLDCMAVIVRKWMVTLVRNVNSSSVDVTATKGT